MYKDDLAINKNPTQPISSETNCVWSGNCFKGEIINEGKNYILIFLKSADFLS